MQLRILYQDRYLVAIDKPSGFHVHPPEDERHRIRRSSNCLAILRKQIGEYLYPVHRIDGATSGVVLFALDPSAAATVQAQFQERRIEKTYYAVARGWVEPASGLIDWPIGQAESRTRYERLATLELPVAVGRYPSARYSLLRVWPETGRMHQIRRHFAHRRHPLVGDSIYGDGKHNRFFRETLPGSGLFLKAHSIRLDHPVSGESIRISGRWGHSWLKLFDLFGYCPWSAR